MADLRKTLVETYVSLSVYVTKKIVNRRRNRKIKERVRKRKTWQEKWLARRDEGRGMLNMLQNELLNEDPENYRNFLRMDNETFQELLSHIREDIAKKNTRFRECISVENRLAVTLRFLASGNSYRDLMFATRIHESTISIIVPEVCESIISRVMHKFLKLPNNEEEWKQVADGFNTIWNFPYCLGALDGKHINFQAPKSAGSFYYNYKGTHSIVLLALVDANYNFLYVDVGVNGRISDGGVFRESTLKNGIEKNVLNFPNDKCLPHTDIKVPYVFVADDAFALSKRLMKPYPQRGLSIDKRIFNYRLSRARRTVENAFAILVNRFRILGKTINLNPQKVELITLTCCVLHNFIAKSNKRYSEIDEEACTLEGLSVQGGSRFSNEAIHIRNSFCKYFNSAGKVPWQNKSAGLE